MDALNADLLACIVCNLSRRDATRARAVCRNFNTIISGMDACTPRPFAERVFVACSRQAKVVEVDPASGEVLALGRWEQRRPASRVAKPSREVNWITGIAMNPADGDVYACQYKIPGIIRFSGGTLQYKHVALKHRTLEHPEGIVFVLGNMYVQTNWGCIASATQNARPAQQHEQQQQEAGPSDTANVAPEGMTGPEPGPDQPGTSQPGSEFRPGATAASAAATGGKPGAWSIQQTLEMGFYITWGLCHYGDSLYSAADRHYESQTYTVPPPGPATGVVLRIQLGKQGQMLSSSGFTKSPIRRPSGLRFDRGGRLWVTSMDAPAGLMCFAGPDGAGAAGPGALLARLALEPQNLYPWDVVVLSRAAQGIAAAGAAGAAGEAAGTAMPLGIGELPEAGASTVPEREAVEDSEARGVGAAETSGTSAPPVQQTGRALPRAAPAGAMEEHLTLVCSMHCGRTLRGLRQEKDCRVAHVHVAVAQRSGGGAPVVRMLGQTAAPLSPGLGLDHANMMCTDL